MRDLWTFFWCKNKLEAILKPNCFWYGVKMSIVYKFVLLSLLMPLYCSLYRGQRFSLPSVAWRAGTMAVIRQKSGLGRLKSGLKWWPQCNDHSKEDTWTGVDAEMGGMSLHRSYSFQGTESLNARNAWWRVSKGSWILTSIRDSIPLSIKRLGCPKKLKTFVVNCTVCTVYW
jgi:hypothetical protein